MMRYEVTTQLTPAEALQRSIMHFGPQGVGLERSLTKTKRV